MYIHNIFNRFDQSYPRGTQDLNRARTIRVHSFRPAGDTKYLGTDKNVKSTDRGGFSCYYFTDSLTTSLDIKYYYSVWFKKKKTVKNVSLRRSGVRVFNMMNSSFPPGGNRKSLLPLRFLKSSQE